MAEPSSRTTETIAEEIRERLPEMTPSERRVARTLLATYPTAGLQSLPQLADGAGVTGPTVLRFVRTVGVAGYPDFQRSLRAESLPALAHRGQECLKGRIVPNLRQQDVVPGEKRIVDESPRRRIFEPLDRQAAGADQGMTLTHVP